MLRTYLQRIIDEARFHVSAAVDRHKINVWCFLCLNKDMGAFISRETSVTHDSHLAMIEELTYPELDQKGYVTFQQDGTVLLHYQIVSFQFRMYFFTYTNKLSKNLSNKTNLCSLDKPGLKTIFCMIFATSSKYYFS